MGTHEVSLRINLQTFYEAKTILCITKHVDSHNCTKLTEQSFYVVVTKLGYCKLSTLNYCNARLRPKKS